MKQKAMIKLGFTMTRKLESVKMSAFLPLKYCKTNFEIALFDSFEIQTPEVKNRV